MNGSAEKQDGKLLEALGKDKPEILGQDLTEDEVRLEFSSLQRFGNVVHLTWSGSLIVAISWTLVRVVMHSNYVFKWANFTHEWATIFLWWFGVMAALWAVIKLGAAVDNRRDHPVAWRYRLSTGVRIGMVAGMVLLFLNS